MLLYRDFVSPEGIQKFIERSPNFAANLEDSASAELLLIRKKKKKKTWLVATSGRLYRVTDRLKHDSPVINWSIPKEELVSPEGEVLDVSTFKSKKEQRLKIRNKKVTYTPDLFLEEEADSAVEHFIRSKMGQGDPTMKTFP